ncbi:MAG: HD domain-containing protein [Candidatus Shapirobacteria bacterium]
MIKIDLSKYEDLYDSFDGGHNRQHLISVRNCALDLAKKYIPNKIDLVYLAATLHDIGLSVNRENHEVEGEKLIRSDSDIKSQLSSEDFEELCHAVGQHRASTGNPKTIVAQIISDADRGGGLNNPGEQFLRAYLYGKKNYLNLTDDEQILRAAEHQFQKFKPGSYGRRTYFPETNIRLNKIYDPIITAYKNKDVELLKTLIRPLLK